ncbi:Uncharacterised protein [Salmonella enterica subsp. enterica serovar Bovismorbificans]|nr:Uncharacterised protein [Salmonella enterica subsp. enterica serovar Bovismorbificans]
MRLPAAHSPPQVGKRRAIRYFTRWRDRLILVIPRETTQEESLKTVYRAG